MGFLIIDLIYTIIPYSELFRTQSHYDTLEACVYSGLTLLLTLFQSYHDGVRLRQGAQCSFL